MGIQVWEGRTRAGRVSKRGGFLAPASVVSSLDPSDGQWDRTPYTPRWRPGFCSVWVVHQEGRWRRRLERVPRLHRGRRDESSARTMCADRTQGWSVCVASRAKVEGWCSSCVARGIGNGRGDAQLGFSFLLGGEESEERTESVRERFLPSRRDRRSGDRQQCFGGWCVQL